MSCSACNSAGLTHPSIAYGNGYGGYGNSLRVGGNAGLQQSGRVQPVTKVQSQTDTSQSSLNLKVTTAEGDTVELSFNISDLAQLQQAHVQNGQGSADAVSATQSHSESFSAKVNGNLSDQELKDIQSLLQYLQTGKPSDQALSSLSGYSGEFSQTQSHSESTFVQYA